MNQSDVFMLGVVTGLVIACVAAMLTICWIGGRKD